MLVRVVSLLNVSLYMFASMILVSLHMEIHLMSVMPCSLNVVLFLQWNTM